MPFENIKIESVEKVEDTNPNLYIRRAEECLKSGNIRQAINECDKAIKFSNNENHYIFEKVRILFSSKLYNECMELLKTHMGSFLNEFNEDKRNEVNNYYSVCKKYLNKDVKKAKSNKVSSVDKGFHNEPIDDKYYTGNSMVSDEDNNTASMSDKSINNSGANEYNINVNKALTDEGIYDNPKDDNKISSDDKDINNNFKDVKYNINNNEESSNDKGFANNPLGDKYKMNTDNLPGESNKDLPELVLSYYKTNNSIFTKGTYENLTDFKQRIKTLPPIPVGKVKISEKYFNGINIMPLKIEWSNWKEINFPSDGKYYLKISNLNVPNDIYNNQTFSVRSKFKTQGEKVLINTDTLELEFNNVYIPLQKINFDKSPFETNNEYKERIEKIDMLPIGNGKIPDEQYDDVTGFCPINITWDNWLNEDIPKGSKYYAFNKHIKNISQDFIIYGKYKVKEENVVLDKIVANIDGEVNILFVLNFKKMPDESENEFTERINKIGILPVGNCFIEKEHYDKISGFCPVTIIWNNIESIIYPNINRYYFIINNDNQSHNDRLKVYSKFSIKNSRVYISKLMIIMGNDIIQLNINNILKNDDESFDDYKNRIENIPLYPVGNVVLSSKYFDSLKNVFNILPDWNSNINIPDNSGFYLQVNEGILNKININYIIYSKLKIIENKVFADLLSMQIHIEDNIFSVYGIIFSEDFYDNQNDFNINLQRLTNVVSGKAALNQDDYHIENNIFNISIEWKDWVESLVKEYKNPYIIIEKDDAKNIYEYSQEYNIYCSFEYNDKINVTEIFIETCIGKIPLNFEGHKYITKPEDEINNNINKSFVDSELNIDETKAIANDNTIESNDYVIKDDDVKSNPDNVLFSDNMNINTNEKNMENVVNIEQDKLNEEPLVSESEIITKEDDETALEAVDNINDIEKYEKMESAVSVDDNTKTNLSAAGENKNIQANDSKFKSSLNRIKEIIKSKKKIMFLLIGIIVIAIIMIAVNLAKSKKTYNNNAKQSNTAAVNSAPGKSSTGIIAGNNTKQINTTAANSAPGKTPTGVITNSKITGNNNIKSDKEPTIPKGSQNIRFTKDIRKKDMNVYSVKAFKNSSTIDFYINYKSGQNRSCCLFNPPDGNILKVFNYNIKIGIHTLLISANISDLKKIDGISINFFGINEDHDNYIDLNFQDIKNIINNKVITTNSTDRDTTIKDPIPPKISQNIRFAKDIHKKDMNVYSVKAFKNSTTIDFYIEYNSGQIRGYSFFNPPEGNILKICKFDSGISIGNHTLLVRAPISELKRITDISVKFLGINEDNENYIFINFEDVKKLLE